MKLAILAAASLTVLSMSLFSQRAHAICGGCAELILIEDKYAHVDPKDDDRVSELSNAASKAIKEMPTGKKMKLKAEQMIEISKLLVAAHPTDIEDALIDNNIKLFNANKVEFFEAFKKFPAKEAEDLRLSLDSKLGEYYNGNDPESVTPKAAAKAPSKSSKK